jgi:hypothetical protein
MAAAALATTAGSCRMGFATRGPIRTLLVCSAIAASVVQPSNHGSEASLVCR